MAVASVQNGTVSVQNSAEIVFVDEDDFPLANLMEHVQSDDDLDNDFELIQDEEEAETPNRTLPVPRGRRNENTEWRRNINIRPDLDFDQPTGVMDITLTPSPWTTLMDYPNGLPKWTTLKWTTPKNTI